MKTRHILTALAGALVAAVVAAPTSAQAAGDLIYQTPFNVTSGDYCPYGQTTGALKWHVATSPTSIKAVDVSGSVVDRPTPTDTRCTDDGRYTVATFTAYRGSFQVEKQTRTVNNNTLQVAFTFGGSTPLPGIDRVVILVCRHSTYGTLAYCGKAQEFRAPVIVG